MNIFTNHQNRRRDSRGRYANENRGATPPSHTGAPAVSTNVDTRPAPGDPAAAYEAYQARLITPGEAAAKCGVHPATLLRWAEAGRIRHLRTPGGHTRYVRADIEAIASAAAKGGPVDDDTTPANLAGVTGDTAAAVYPDDDWDYQWDGGPR